MRSLPFYPLLVILLIGLGAYVGCDPNSASQLKELLQETAAFHPPQNTTLQHNSTAIPARTTSTILIGSFNMQRLGPSKLSNPWVMERFAAIISHFDVIALQEITSKDQRTLPILVDLVNKQGLQYAYTISPRIGREGTGYFEQYAFVFDTRRIAGGADYCYVVSDEQDILHREPFVGRFRSLYPNQPFTFSLINIHTDPGEVREEIIALASTFKNVRQFEYPEDDVIILGDLNAEPKKLQPLLDIPGMTPLIVGVPTNTRRNKTIDNILIDRASTLEFTGRAGAIDLEQMFGIDLRDAERLSDHLPIWAEFTASERTQQATATAAGAGPSLNR
jgi:deoxyribonuclease-1-like protein